MTNEVKTIENLTLTEWNNLVSARKSKFYAELGKRPPTYKQVAAAIPNRDPLDVYDYVWVLLFIVGFIFTSIKVAAASVPYSDGVLAHMSQDGYIVDWVHTALQFFSASLFILAAGPSVVFFKIVDHLPSTQAAKKQSEMVFERRPQGWEWVTTFPLYVLRTVISFEWLTPRLPGVITYMSIGWLIHISVSGGGNIFEIVLPLLIEIGLADRIARIIEKVGNYRSLIVDNLEQRQKRYAQRKQDFMNDKQFLQQFHADVREALTKIKRNGVQPNAWLENAESSVIDQAILSQYRRYTGGLHFAEAVQGLNYETKLATTDEIVPPNGAKAWTPETLLADLLGNGITGDISETFINERYGGKYAARKAWRDGAKAEYAKRK